jgi:hypothetical protein
MPVFYRVGLVRNNNNMRVVVVTSIGKNAKFTHQKDDLYKNKYFFHIPVFCVKTNRCRSALTASAVNAFQGRCVIESSNRIVTLNTQENHAERVHA